MARPTLFETDCPSCNRTFDVEEGSKAGHCPYCNAYLSFVDDEATAAAEPEAEAGPTSLPPPMPAPPMAPPPPPAEPAPEPEPMAAEEPAPTNAIPPPAAEPAPMPEGEFQVNCPSCQGSFGIDADDASGSCPSCATSLTFENVYAESEPVYTVACPACQGHLEAQRDQTTATCPHCSARLVLDDVYAGEERVLAPPTPVPPPEPEPVAAPAPPKTAEPVPVPEAPPSEPAPPAPEPSPEASSLPMETPEGVPRAIIPPAGLPYTLDCPVCHKAFAIAAKDREGNCPNCNAPLAFLSEKEYNALQVAEERKRAFQEKMRRRREARLAREAEAGQKSLIITRWFKGRKITQSEAPEATPTLAPEAVVAPVEAPPRKKGKKESEPVAVIESPEAPVFVAPEPVAFEPPPPALEPKRKRRKEPEPELLPSMATMPELAPAEPVVQEAPTKKRFWAFGRGAPAAQEPAAVAEVSPGEITFGETLVETRTETPAPKRGRRATSPAPAPALAEEPVMDISVGEEITAGPAEPAPQKKGFSRFFRMKDAAPEATAAAPAAVVEEGGIDFGGFEAPAPAEAIGEAARAPKRGKRDKAPPTTPAAVVSEGAAFEMGEVSFDAPAAAAPEPEPAKKGFASRLFRRESKPEADAPPAATVEEGGVEFGGFETPAPAPPVEKPAKATRSKKKAREPDAAPAEPEPAIQIVHDRRHGGEPVAALGPESQPVTIEMEETAIASSPAAPEPPAKGGLFRRRKQRGETHPARQAAVVESSIDFGEVEARPAKKSKK